MKQSNILSLNLNDGWNLISGLDSMISFIEDPEKIIIPNTLYEFNKIYQSASNLEPGKGYWIRARESGIIRIISNSQLTQNNYNISESCKTISLNEGIYTINNFVPINSNGLEDHIGKKIKLNYNILNYIPIKIESYAICSVLDLDKFNKNRANWENNSLNNYSFNFRWICYCPDSYTQTVSITVINNEIREIIPTLSNLDFDESNYKTIDQLFDFVENKFNSYEISINYDDRFGFISSCFIDESKMIADEEIGFEITNFKPKTEGIFTIRNDVFSFVDTHIFFEVTASTKDSAKNLDLEQSIITLSYGKCNVVYELDDSATVGYFYNGRKYTSPNMIRYSEDGIVTEDYVPCRITIVKDELTIEDFNLEGFLVKTDTGRELVETDIVFNVEENDDKIILEYNNCSKSYIINNSENYGYFYKGNLYFPEDESLLRYGDIFTHLYIPCCITINTSLELSIQPNNIFKILDIEPKNFIIGNTFKYAITLPEKISFNPNRISIGDISISDINLYENIIYGDITLNENETPGKKKVEVIFSDRIFEGIVEFSIPIISNLNSITHYGVKREYLLYSPDSYNENYKYPIIFNFHGFGGQVKDYIISADLREQAEDKNIILVYPQGLTLGDKSGTHWNAALPGDDNKSDVDDFGFILELIKKIKAEFSIDQNRIYACGYSNGAFFSYALGLYYSDIFASIGSVSGTMINDLSEKNKNKIITPLPMINIHGINDSTVPYSGSTDYNSIPNVIDFYNDLNQITTKNEIGNDTHTHTIYGGGINGASVEHYKMKNGNHIWYPELNNQLCDFLLKNNLNGLIYDFIIVGGGPSGIMSTYRIATQNPDKRVLLIEKNEHTLNQYKTEYDLQTGTTIENQPIIETIDYKNAFRWRISQEDQRFQYSFASDDNKGIWLGKGLGGGTLHFGLQYIDNEEVINNFNPDWKSDFEAVAEITGAQKYDNLDNESYTKLKDAIENENGIKYFNNKVYSDNLDTKKRLLLGDLINNLPNVEIKYGINILKYNNSNVEDSNGIKYYGKNFIMCAGAIQTPAILLRSGIDCGNNLYDHSGFHLVYGKNVPKEETTTQPYQGDKIFTLDQDTLETLNDKTSRVIRRAQGTKTTDEDNVYDFTDWASNHGGGSDRIISHNGDYILKMPSSHEASRWTGRSSNFRTLIGKYEESVNINDLPENDTTNAINEALFPDEEVTTTTNVPLDLGLDTENILSHVQTRDDEMTWQSYYSTIPKQETILVVTNALASDLSSAGKVVLDPEDNTKNPLVTLNHFDGSDNYLNYLKNAFYKNDSILQSLGYQVINPPQLNTKSPYFDETFISKFANSIYHYHGTCAIGKVVDESQKVNGKDNLYIGDVSVLNKPWAGSTSVPALVTGYRVAKNFI